MTAWEELLIGAALLAVLAALVLAAWGRWRTRRVMLRLERMLEEAIRGTFTETSFDESLFSAVETQLAHYLAASAVSARNLQEEKNKIKSLIADISHQTKTPITNVLLYAQLLGEQDLPEESRALVTALEGQAEKLQSLIEALVKTSRLETGILELHPRPGLLGPMLEDAAAQFAPKTAAKELTLQVIAPEMQAVFDAKWTEEAVCNLLDNAVKYTPAGGSITLEAIAYELFCRIDVTDTGPGIPEAEQARVFQRFYRSAAAYEAEGVGIGLYLSRQIVQGQGGYLKVFSRPGYGAKFSMYLPRETNL